MNIKIVRCINAKNSRFLMAVIILLSGHFASATDLRITLFMTEYAGTSAIEENLDYQGELIKFKSQKWHCEGKFRSKKNPLDKSDIKMINLVCKNWKKSIVASTTVNCNNALLFNSTELTLGESTEIEKAQSLIFICYDHESNLLPQKTSDKIKTLKSMAIGY